MICLPEKIVSGGQTGVDRAALDAAIACHIPHGGWCPKNRIAEDGIIPRQYQLIETPTEDYAERTQWNVRDADGTLILLQKEPASGGTLLTLQLAQKLNKPYFIVNLSEEQNLGEISAWIKKNHIRILNIAGPRESHNVGIYQSAYQLLYKLFKDEFSPQRE